MPRQESVAEDRRPPHAGVRITTDLEVLAVQRTNRSGGEHESEAKQRRNDRINGEDVFESHNTPW